MASGPRVSVVAIFLNAQRFLREAIDSVLVQTYSDWELVLVDDGSSDSSASIALDYSRKYPERIRYQQHPDGANRGMSASRNLGIRASRGVYIALLDSDDVWLPRKLEQQVAVLDAYPSAALVFGAAEYWCGWTGRPEDQARDNVPALGFDVNCVHHPPSLAVRLHPLGLGTAPCPSDLLLRRSVVQRLGGFEESFLGSNQLYEDQAFLAKVYLHEPVYASSETWIRYRIHRDSCSSAAARTGTQAAARQFFLAWLARYLQVHAIDDPDVHLALRQAREGVDLRGASRPAWNLRVAGGSMARLAQYPGPPTVLRVEIDTTSGTSHDVQVNWPHLRLEAGHGYAVRLEARSEAPRPVLVGIAEAHPPWAGLGWFTSIGLTPEWQTIEGNFVASRDEANARIHVDLGEAPIAVELRNVSLLRGPESTVVEAENSAEASSALLGGLRRLTPLSRTWGFDRGLPIDRHYIEAFLGHYAPDIRGRVLEVEDDTYARRFGGRAVSMIDVLHVGPGNPRATLIGDLSNAPHLPSNAFDAIILTQTLHLIFDTRAALETLWRLLRPDGVLLATFPGLSKVSRTEWADSWFWGFTTASARRLFESQFGARQVHVQAFGNVLTSIAFLHGLAAEELRPEELTHQDAEYELLIAVRAVKAPGPETAST